MIDIDPKWLRAGFPYRYKFLINYPFSSISSYSLGSCRVLAKRMQRMNRIIVVENYFHKQLKKIPFAVFKNRITTVLKYRNFPQFSFIQNKFHISQNIPIWIPLISVVQKLNRQTIFYLVLNTCHPPMFHIQ